MFSFIFLVLSGYVSGVLSGMLGPCTKEDSECLQMTINKVFPIVFEGIPSLGVPRSDPMFEEVIEGNLSVLKYKFMNSTITGYKECEIKNSTFDVEALKLYFEMHCFNLKMVGDYEINGKLAALPVEGKGTYILTGKYLVPIDAGLKIIKGKDGKSYANIKNFKLKPKVLGPLKFEFSNLFNGQKDLSDAVHNFAHENYMEVADLVQDPIFNAGVKSISRNINAFLKTQPLEEIFTD